MYFLTIKAGNEVLRDRAPFTDYADALAACGEYYEPRAVGAALNFTSIVTGKKFMRSYAQLTRLADLADVPRDSPQAVAAAKQSNAFSFSKSYAFLVESAEGVQEAEKWAREDNE
ncbi:hypothetical protein KAK11_16650 [Ideonella paludis]|uniref:Uncharacterized protein n=2 Tax=Ideonella paludis TaxID=1233411 RepID=A0ABS5E0Y2_9BURK|nr:hypothetical protein [Ideonella paludis]